MQDDLNQPYCLLPFTLEWQWYDALDPARLQQRTKADEQFFWEDLTAVNKMKTNSCYGNLVL